MIDSKAKMYRLYERGAFGNKLRTWPSYWQWSHDHSGGGTFTLRTAGAAGGGKTSYRNSSEAVTRTFHRWAGEGVNPTEIRINESAPDELLVIQGEVMRGTRGLELRFNLTPGLKMREALTDPMHARGLEADHILRKLLYPASYADLTELLDLYPGHVAEFSAYRIPVGNLRGRNAVVWECRLY